MRLKLLFEKEVLGDTQKIWVDPPDLETVQDFIEYLRDQMQIPKRIDLYIEDFFVHPSLSFFIVVKDSDIIQIKQSSDESINRKQEARPVSPISAPLKFKFNKEGKVIDIKRVETDLNILSPAEEFELKRSEWKIKPIPKRKPKDFLCPDTITTEDKVIFFNELEVGMKVNYSTRHNPRVQVLFI